MATFVAISEKTQTATAMKRVLNYVMQDKKTNYNGVNLVSGQNCVPESAYEEFMATKNQYGKANGVFFKQYVQSFKPDCGVTPQTIHKIGLEMAKAFDGFEVVVATHIDRDHWHNHFVVNSVNCETGYKIQINEKGLEQLRKKSDEICQQYGLETLKPYEKPKQRSMNQKEYRTALRGDNKKIKLTNAIDYAVAKSKSKNQFIDEMKKLGYGVKWIDSYKYITYTTPDGQRFRDNRLLDNKYLKTNMEELFTYGYEQIKTIESDRTSDKRNNQRIDRADTTNIPDAETGTVQCDSTAHLIDWESHCRKHGFDIRITDTGRFESDSGRNTESVSVEDNRYYRARDEVNEWYSQQQTYRPDEYSGEEGLGAVLEYSGEITKQRENVEQTQNEVGCDWSELAIDTMHLINNISMIGRKDEDDEEKPKCIKERKNYQKKKNGHTHDGGMQMSM